MPKITFIRHDGVPRTIDARGGQSLMEAAVDQSIDGIEAACGGACSCATCHIYVDDVWLARLEPSSALERDLLSAIDGAGPQSRLACQIKVTEGLNGLVVQTPASQG